MARSTAFQNHGIFKGSHSALFDAIIQQRQYSWSHSGSGSDWNSPSANPLPFIARAAAQVSPELGLGNIPQYGIPHLTKPANRSAASSRTFAFEGGISLIFSF